MRLPALILLLIRRSPLLLAGLVLGALSLAEAFLVPHLHSGPVSVDLGLIEDSSLMLALIMIGGGILDVLVRVIPECCRETERLRRLRAGLCVRCEYDLRGSSDRCPECGTPFERWARGPNPL